MRRWIAPLFVVAALCGALLLADGRVAAQALGERVTMTPSEGTLQTRFTFAGAGFTPGSTVAVRVVPPDGIERRPRDPDGAELVWLVAPDGGFALEIIPARRFPGAPAGHWRMLFCAAASPTCQLLEFDVTP